MKTGISNLSLITLAAVISLTISCKAEEAKPAATVPVLPNPTDPVLIKGKSVWLGTCKTCHLTGLGGAPTIGNKEKWLPRIKKKKQTLFKHALNGFIGPEGTEMPARGGNKKLTDNEVKAAVLFMISAVDE